MQTVYIIHAKRTPIGKIGGVLASVRVDDLMATLLKDFNSRNLFAPEEIDDIIVGCANQAGEDNRNIARMASLLAGLPFEVPGTTINRLCGSSLDATMSALARIQAGLAECILVGGAESMSRAPFVISKAQSAFGRDQKMYDSSFGWRFPNKELEKRFPLLGMGETAENIADLYNISREEQDRFAYNSHQKTIQAKEAGFFKKEIIPIEVKQKKSSNLVSDDECPRKETSLEKLAKLKPVFKKNGSVTAGNSSPMNDGAAMLAIVSKNFLEKHKLTPLVEITGATVRGVHPDTMGLGPIAATNLLLKKYNKKISDFDVVELNEAFSVQALACIKELKIDENKVNMYGGSIAIGHPLGCSGARILTTLVNIMTANKNFKEGLATMCIGVGQGISISVKKPEL